MREQPARKRWHVAVVAGMVVLAGLAFAPPVASAASVAQALLCARPAKAAGSRRPGR